MTPREATQLTDEHPLLRLNLTASEARLLADLLRHHLENAPQRSQALNTLAQQLLVRAALIEHRTPQA